MRKVEFANGEIYHVYNRGTDKRTVFEDNDDLNRFIESMQDFNKEEPIGSLYEYSFVKNQLGSSTSKLRNEKPLVRFIAYCLNPNHFHFLIEQLEDEGIPKFMHRLSTGYTKYFNKKYRRTGALFSGRYKSIHVDENEYLLRLSAYVNLNDRVHHLDGSIGLKSISSWSEYQERYNSDGFCDTSIILEQFRSAAEYQAFALSALGDINENKERAKELDELREF